MILAIPTDDAATVSKVFGRAAQFALYRQTDQSPQLVPGTATAEHGAGTGAVSKLVGLGVSDICAAELGPKAYDAIVAAGIRVTLVKPGIPLAEAAKQGYSS
jgi:predicted Fe-Mo cluster-binding NifX family protein